METQNNLFKELSNLLEIGSLNIPSNEELKHEIDIFSKHLFIDSTSLFNYAYLCNYFNTLKSNFHIYINVFNSSSIKSPSQSQLIINIHLNLHYKNIVIVYQSNINSFHLNEKNTFSLYNGSINYIGIIKQKEMIYDKAESSQINAFLQERDINRNNFDNTSNLNLYIITQLDDSIPSNINRMNDINIIFYPNINHLTQDIIVTMLSIQSLYNSQEDYSKYILQKYMPKLESKPYESYFYINHFSKHELFFNLSANIIIGLNDDDINIKCDLLNQYCPNKLIQSQYFKTIKLKANDNICFNTFIDDILSLAISEYTYYSKLMKTIKLSIDDSLHLKIEDKDNEGEYKSIYEITSIKTILLNLNRSEIEKFNILIPEQIELLIEDINKQYEDSSKKIKTNYSRILIPTSADIDKIVQKYSDLIKELKDKVEESIAKIIDFEAEIINTMQKYVADCGIYSENFNKFILNNKPQEDIICALKSLFSNENELQKALQNLGISATTGVVSGLTTFGITRLIAIIGTDALVGSSGGPIGTIIGIIIGLGSFIGQGLYNIFRNKKKIELVHQDLETATKICVQLLIQKVKDFAEVNKKEMNNMLEEVNLFSLILISRRFKLDKSN